MDTINKNNIKLSLAIATHNEEKNLEKCLESAVGLVDEIVIADGGSTDKTLEIAKKFNAKIILTDNPPIFHITKQKAVDACSGDWILQLDADEILMPELVKETQEVINNNDYNGYSLPRKNYFMGRWMRKAGMWPDRVIRLFRNGYGKFPCKSVHEQIKIDGEIGELENPLIHNPFPDLYEYLVKLNRYTELRAREFNNNRSWFNLIKYSFFIPKLKFLSLYFRHRGYEDGLPGFIFAVLSSWQEAIAYWKYYEKDSK